MPPTLARASLRVLLVEDNTTDALVACDELAHAIEVIFIIEQATRLQAALALLAGSAFDVVLLDLSLPDCDGLDTFLQLRAAAPDLPVVVLSHRADEALSLMCGSALGSVMSNLPRTWSSFARLTRRHIIVSHDEQIAIRFPGVAVPAT